MIDLITLDCKSEIVYSLPEFRSDYDGISPPSYILLFPGSSKEPLLNFFSQAGYPFYYFCNFYKFIINIIIFDFW